MGLIFIPVVASLALTASLAVNLNAGATSALHQDPNFFQSGPTSIRLWNGNAPGAQGSNEEDVPTITPFLAKNPNGAAVVICPGGGYQFLAKHEGVPPAQMLNKLGISAFVLRYRLGPKYQAPCMLEDVQRAIRMVRFRAKEWKIDPNKVGVMGFSAGGHLAASAATLYDYRPIPASDPVDQESARPDAAMLIYPVISMEESVTHQGSRDNLLGKNPDPAMVTRYSTDEQVNKNTPPSFVVQTEDDGVVPMENAWRYVDACRKNGVKVEFLLIPSGPHGFGLGGGNRQLNQWPSLAARWLETIGFTTPPAPKRVEK